MVSSKHRKLEYNHIILTHSNFLTHWGRVTHICVGNLTNIDSDNGLSPGRRQAIIWPNAGLLLIGPLGTNFNEILIEILTFSFKKMRLKVSSAKRRPFCLGLNELTDHKLATTHSFINRKIKEIYFHKFNACKYSWELLLYKKLEFHCNVLKMTVFPLTATFLMSMAQ